MVPRVRHANDAVLAERRAIVRIQQRIEGGDTLTAKDQALLNSLLATYKVKHSSPPSERDITRLLRRVDAVPASLILAQAANESAWGTSRFARNGNNFFGIWCFTPGCGLTPRFRDDGLTHEVKRFESVQAGVEYYLLMINTNGAYRDLRDVRARLRQEGKASGMRLAEGLLRYSERGMEYVREIQAMIRINRLQQYNRMPSVAE
jgi:Bax protein